eukprot:5371171-Alexandrium_andersonii.AAC.1
MLQCLRRPEALFCPTTAIIVNGIASASGILRTPDTAREANILFRIPERVPRRMVTCPKPLGFHGLRWNGGGRNLGTLPRFVRSLGQLGGADEERGGPSPREQSLLRTALGAPTILNDGDLPIPPCHRRQSPTRQGEEVRPPGNVRGVEETLALHVAEVGPLVATVAPTLSFVDGEKH